METGLGIKDPLIVETPLGQSGIVPTFREQVFGAGSSIAKFNDDGFFMGATNFADAPFKVTYAGDGTFNSLTITGGTIKAGQTAYDSGTGYWLGTVSGTPKFSLGNSAGNKMTWDGASLALVGSITATSGDISGNLTVSGSLLSDDGATFQTKIYSGKIGFLKNAVEKAFIKTASDSASLQCATGSYFYITKYDGTPIFRGDQNANWLLNNGGASLEFATGAKITDSSGSMTITGSISPVTDNNASLGSATKRWTDIWATTVVAWGTGGKFSCQGSDGIDDDDVYVASSSGGSPTKRLKFKGGILYSSS